MSEIVDTGANDVHFKASIPDGEYIVKYIGYYTAKMFRQQTPKVSLRFSIVEGDYEGFELERHYTVSRLIGEPGPSGQFKATSQTCVLLMEYCTCFPDQELTRLDRIPMTRWHEGSFRVLTRRSQQNHARKLIPAMLRSSVIGEILGRVE